MVAGQIGYRILGGVPNLIVCDGARTAGLPLILHNSYHHTPVNGEIIVTTGLGAQADWEIGIGYGGYWWHTEDLWQDVSASFVGGEPGAIKVVYWTYTGINLPVILLTNPSYKQWACKDGWFTTT